MESVISYFQTLNFNIGSFWKSAGILLAVSLILALLGRFIFGKKSVICASVSSAIGILFIYAVTILLTNAGEPFQRFITPLPFVSFSENTLYLFTFQAEYTVVCSQILSMVILAFLMNLANSWLPTGKHLLSWLFFRCVSVALGLIMHLIVTELFTTYLPDGLVIYAPTILLALLVLMLLTGALKFLVGLLLTSVNPLIAALYTFFFANIIGKQLTKAVLTTGILAGLVLLLQKIGVFALSIASSILITYIPLIILLVILWYLIDKVL